MLSNKSVQLQLCRGKL